MTEAGNLFSEFAGYGTAELALHSALTKTKMNVDSFGQCSADYNSKCQQLLMANAVDTDKCVFGDILNLVPDTVRGRLFEEIQESFTVTHDDLKVALKFLHKGSGASAKDLFTQKHRLKCPLGPVGRDFGLIGLDDGAGKPRGSASTAIKRLTRMISSTRCSPSTFIFSRRTHLGFEFSESIEHKFGCLLYSK